MIHVSRLILAVVIYAFCVLTLLAFRPALMFDAEGNPKPCGLGLSEGQSFLAPCVVFPLLAVCSYFVSTLMSVAIV